MFLGYSDQAHVLYIPQAQIIFGVWLRKIIVVNTGILNRCHSDFNKTDWVHNTQSQAHTHAYLREIRLVMYRKEI